MMIWNGGLAARVFDLSAGIVCGKGCKVSVSHIPSENGTRFVIVGTMRFGSTQAGSGYNVMVVRTTIVVVVVVVVVVGVGHGVYGGGGEVILKNCRKVLLDLYAKQISSPPV
jgi:hypothetical protein